MIRAIGDELDAGIDSQVVADNSLFFVASDSGQHYQLWKSDGTSDGTVAVIVDFPSPIGFHTSFWVAGNTLYFPLKTDKFGNELHALSISDLKIARDGFITWNESQSLANGLAAPHAMPYGDGVENLLKYAFFMDGAHADRHVMTPGSGTDGLPCVSTLVDPTGGKIVRVEFIGRKDSGLIYRPLFSNTLVPGSFVVMNGDPVVTDVDAGRARVIVEHKTNPASNSAGYGVVEVSVD